MDTGKSLTAATVLLAAACYTYRPLQAPEPAAGTRISAQLTPDGSRALAYQIGPEVLHVEGDVLAADSAGLALAVRQVENYRGRQSSWNGEPVRVPRSAIAGLQERRLSVGGTGLMGGLVVAGLFGLYEALGGGGSSGRGPTGGGGPQ